MEAYGGGQSTSNNEESTQGYKSKGRDLELRSLEKNKKKQNKNKKRRVFEELVECSGNKKEKDELGVCGEHQYGLTTSLDNINYNVLDWESVMTNMAEEVNFVIKTMVQLLGVNKEVALLQFELLLKSLHIRKDYILLVLKALKKEYVSEEEEYQVLKKIWDVKMEHVQLIRDEHFNLIKMGKEKGNKKQKMAEKAEDEENNNFDGKQLVLCIEKLQDIQDKLEKINEEARDEVLKIAQKFSQIRKPFYEKRNDIIKTIPNFWLTAFLRHPILGNLVSTEEDHEICKYLSSIEVEDTEDFKSGFTITFYFSPNPFSENTMLSKTYTFLEDGRPKKVTASTVQWKEGNGVVSHAEEGFFRWFSSEVDHKYDEVAAIIKDELWPNPLNYFNEADEEKDFHESDESSDEVVKDSENDGDEKAGEADKKDVEAADKKDSENDGDVEADEEDLEAAGGSGNEVVKDSEDDDEEADEEDLEAVDEAGDEGTKSEGSYDDYDLGG